MHRLPKIVIFHKKSRNSNKMVGRGVGGSPGTPKPKPRLERLIASKNIDYELPSTSSLYFEDSSESTSSPSSASPELRTRSLDASPLAVSEQTSIRIEGTEGECEMIYRLLGVSGPEDFAIPADDWEAMKVRSSADVLVPRFSQLNYSVCSPKGCDSEAQTKRACPGVVSDVSDPKMEGFETFYSRKPSFSLTRPEMEGIDFGCSDSIASSNVSLTSPQIVGIDFGCSNGSGGSDASSKIDLVCSNKFVASNVIMNTNKLILGDCRNVPSDGVCELSDRLASIVVCDFSDRLGDCVRANDVALTTNGAGDPSGVRGSHAIVDDGESGESGKLLGDCVRANDVALTKNVAGDPSGVRDSHAIVNDGESGKLLGRGGIKGARPPALAPPPVMSLPVIDNGCSTWDILKSFAPENERDSWRFKDSGAVSSDDEEIRESYVEEEEEVHDVVVRSIAGVNGALLGSGSCSFTTNSIDDDSSSTTTEPMSNNSPNRRFRCIVTWEKGELLGRGSFGAVYEGIADDGFFIAVKEVSLLDQGEEGRQSIFQLQQEIALLSQFEHENIVQYYGTEKDESKLYIFLELVTKGSLLNLYQKYNLRDSQVSAYTRQILHGLKYLHDRNVVHRDIKCANILVDANGSVKLADFGLAKATKLNDVKSCKGTPFWMAPEVVNRRNQGYGLAADIWSLGCTVLEMLTRRFPYSHLEPVAALFRIGKGEPPQIPETLSCDAREFILKCLQVNPNARPTAAQLLDHPFVKRPLPSSCTASPYHPSRRI